MKKPDWHEGAEKVAETIWQLSPHNKHKAVEFLIAFVERILFEMRSVGGKANLKKHGTEHYKKMQEKGLETRRQRKLDKDIDKLVNE